MPKAWYMQAVDYHIKVCKLHSLQSYSTGGLLNAASNTFLIKTIFVRHYLIFSWHGSPTSLKEQSVALHVYRATLS